MMSIDETNRLLKAAGHRDSFYAIEIGRLDADPVGYCFLFRPEGVSAVRVDARSRDVRIVERQKCSSKKGDERVTVVLSTGSGGRCGRQDQRNELDRQRYMNYFVIVHLFLTFHLNLSLFLFSSYLSTASHAA